VEYLGIEGIAGEIEFRGLQGYRRSLEIVYLAVLECDDLRILGKASTLLVVNNETGGEYTLLVNEVNPGLRCVQPEIGCLCAHAIAPDQVFPLQRQIHYRLEIF
jgi:hypothetical protein